MPTPATPEAVDAKLADVLLTPREAAEALAISPRSLWSLGQSGELPVVRIGRSVRYSRRAVERFIDARSK